MPHLYCI